MKVKELIKKLEKMPQESEVILYTEGDTYYSSNNIEQGFFITENGYSGVFYDRESFNLLEYNDLDKPNSVVIYAIS